MADDECPGHSARVTTGSPPQGRGTRMCASTRGTRPSVRLTTAMPPLPESPRQRSRDHSPSERPEQRSTISPELHSHGRDRRGRTGDPGCGAVSGRDSSHGRGAAARGDGRPAPCPALLARWPAPGRPTPIDCLWGKPTELAMSRAVVPGNRHTPSPSSHRIRPTRQTRPVRRLRTGPGRGWSPTLHGPPRPTGSVVMLFTGRGCGTRAAWCASGRGTGGRRSWDRSSRRRARQRRRWWCRWCAAGTPVVPL